MNRQVEQLCGDPLFQLNMAIWLSRPTPGIVVRPVFYESGFNIYSIGLALPIPPDIRLILNESGMDYQESSMPDMVLANADRKKICILECKKSSFGVGSSTALQAKTLMVISGPVVAEILAVGLRNHSMGILAYLTRRDQVDSLQDTLEKLANELAKIKIDTGVSGCLGIGCNEKSVTIEYSEDFKEIMNFKHDSPVEVLLIESDTDPRPLYFIPYDPSAFNQQCEDEQKICRRILYERFLSHILSKVGSVSIAREEKIVLSTDEITSMIKTIQSQTNETADAITQVVNIIDKVSDLSFSITTFISEQATVTNEISDVIITAAGEIKETHQAISELVKLANADEDKT